MTEKSNILIIEDHELTRFGLKTAFEDAEFLNQLFEADSAEKGIDILQNEKIDLIIIRK